MIRLIGVIVAVVDEVIRDGMAVAGVEFLEQGLGDFPLLEPDLADEVICLRFPKVFELRKVQVGEKASDGINLIGSYGGFPGLAIGGMEGHVDPVIPDPLLGGFGNMRVSGGNPLMTAMDIRIRKSGTGNAGRESATGTAEGVVGSPTPDAEGGTLGT